MSTVLMAFFCTLGICLVLFLFISFVYLVGHLDGYRDGQLDYAKGEFTPVVKIPKKDQLPLELNYQSESPLYNEIRNRIIDSVIELNPHIKFEENK